MVSTNAGKTETPSGSSAKRRIGALGEGAIESGAPPGQTALFVGDVVAFVGYIVDQAHEGVEGGEAVALGLGQEEKGVIKIAVRGFDDALAFFVRVGHELTAAEFCRSSGLRFVATARVTKARPSKRTCLALLMEGRRCRVS